MSALAVGRSAGSTCESQRGSTEGNIPRVVVPGGLLHPTCGIPREARDTSLEAKGEQNRNCEI